MLAVSAARQTGRISFSVSAGREAGKRGGGIESIRTFTTYLWGGVLFWTDALLILRTVAALSNPIREA